jgi:hypothetical protein
MAGTKTSEEIWTGKDAYVVSRGNWKRAGAGKRHLYARHGETQIAVAAGTNHSVG